MSADLPERRSAIPQDIRTRLAGILAAVAARTSAQAARRRNRTGDAGARHLAALRAGLARKIHVIIWGAHSPDWMSALAPSAPVWRDLDLVGAVSQIPAQEANLARVVRRDFHPVLIPLMETHARLAPADVARSSPAVELIDLLAEKDLFAAYLEERGLARHGPRHYWTLDEVQYPCVVKPTDLNGGTGISIATDRAHLERIMAWLRSHGKRFVVQAWVGGTDEYVTHAVMQGGKILWDLTFRYHIEGENTIRTGDVSRRSRVERVAAPAALRRILARIGRDLDVTGPVNVDYKLVDGRPVVFEINPRLGGSLMRPDNADALREALRAVVDCAAASDRFFAGVVRTSDVFDAQFYTDPVNEFEPPARDPALHYFREGHLQGRDPCGVFSSNDYRALHLDGQPDLNPLVHYELSGRERGLAIRRTERRLLKSALITLNNTRRPPRQGGEGSGPGPFPAEREAQPTAAALLRRRRRIPLGLAGKAEVCRITAAEAERIIADRKLGTVGNSWHYSWDLQRFFPELYLYETSANSYVFHDQPIPYVSAPAPLYSDDAAARIIAHRGRFFPFWFLHYGSFEAFLERRSRASGKPAAHFPTRETYPRVCEAQNSTVQRLPLRGNEELFIQQFNQWKDRRFGLSGDACLSLYRAMNPAVPAAWFWIYLLTDRTSGRGRGVMLTIEDGRSSAMLNLANERGCGVFMVVEAFRLMAGLGYASLNGGVSGIYGSYKDVLFLDRMETDATGFLPVGAARAAGPGASPA